MRVSLVTGGSIQSSGRLAKSSGILYTTRGWPEADGSVFGMDYGVFNHEAMTDLGEVWLYHYVIYSSFCSLVIRRLVCWIDTFT